MTHRTGTSGRRAFVLKSQGNVGLTKASTDSPSAHPFRLEVLLFVCQSQGIQRWEDHSFAFSWGCNLGQSRNGFAFGSSFPPQGSSSCDMEAAILRPLDSFVCQPNRRQTRTPGYSLSSEHPATPPPVPAAALARLSSTYSSSTAVRVAAGPSTASASLACASRVGREIGGVPAALSR